MSNYKLNAFPLGKGMVNLTTGTYGEGIFYCIEDGDLTITWEDASTDTISCVAGNAFEVHTATSVVITSGTFHKA